MGQFLFRFEFSEGGIKNTISGFSIKESDDFPQIYSARMYFIYKKTIYLNYTLNHYYRLTYKWIEGWVGDIHLNLKGFQEEIYFTRNFRGKPASVQIYNETKNMSIHTNYEFAFNVKMTYNMKNRGVEEIYSGEIKSEIMINGYFPLYYYLNLNKKTNVDLDIYIRLNSYDMSLLKNNFEINGYILNEDKINKIMNGEYMILQDYSPITGNYTEIYGYGFLQINRNQINGDGKYILISISNKDKKFFNSYLLVEVIYKEHFNDSLLYFMPINQYLLETFGQNDSSISSVNKYQIAINNRYHRFRHHYSEVLVEFSPNYEDLILNFEIEDDDDNFTCQVLPVNGFKKYRIINTTKNQLVFNVNNTHRRKDANYLIRYFYTEFADENQYYLSKYTSLKKENINHDNITISIIFDNIYIISNSTPLDNTGYNITFYIDAFLFPKNNSESELVNTSAIIYNRKYLYRAETTHSIYRYDKNICLKFKDISRKDNYEYVLQIRVNLYIADSIQNEEFLTFTYDVDLTDIKLEEEDNTLKIVLGVVGGVLLILIILIVFFFVYRKLRRDNSQLKEQVLDLGYSAGVQKNILKKEINSKKDEDYETEFI